MIGCPPILPTPPVLWEKSKANYDDGLSLIYPLSVLKKRFFLTGQNIKIFAQNLDPEFTFE